MDNKGHCLIFCDASAMLAMDHRLALIPFFESEPNFHSASLPFFGIAMWLFGLQERVSSAKWACYRGGSCIAKALLRLSMRHLHVLLVVLVLLFF
jgi:hypothetical protein